MVHVCFVSPKIHNFLDVGEPSGAGGAERQQYLVGRELLDRDHEVSLLTRNFDGGRTMVRSDGFEVWKTIPDIRGGINAPYKAFRVADTLRRIDADVHYVRGNDFLCMVVSAYCQAGKGHFVYGVSSDADVDPHRLEDYHSLRRRAFLAGVRNADAVAAQTEHQRDVLMSTHGISSTIIGNGYRVPDRESVIQHADREYVLWVGRMDAEQKHPERFFRLAESLPEYKFVIVGPPNDDEEEYFEKLRSWATEVPNLQFKGLVPPDQMDDYFQRAVALVNTSDYEGLPNVFLEAWRYATPVISLHYNLDDALDDDIGIHSGQMSQLAKDITRLIVDVDERARLGWNGRDYLRKNYSMTSVTDRYEQLFEHVVSE